MQIDRRQFNALAGSVLLSSAWTSPAHAQAAAAQGALYEAAKKEGEVTWYIVYLPSEDADILSKAFTERYPGVKVNVVRTTAQVAFQRLNQDLRASTANCDVFASTDIAHFVDLKKRKLLMQYKPQAAATMDKRLQNLDPDNYYHAVNVAMIGLVYNTAKVKPADVPTSWNDLIDPKWKGLASVGHPGFSGFVGVWAIEMRRLYGEDWFKKLADNKPQVGRSIIDTVTTVVSGERSISAGPINLAALVAAKGNPVGISAPKEGTVLMLSPSAIMANTPHPNASKLFLEWIMGSDDVQKLAYERYGVPIRAGMKPREGVPSMDDVKIVLRPTPAESVTGVPEVIELWRDAFGV